MKFLITGITGFNGPHMAKKLLDEGHEVHGMVRKPLAPNHEVKMYTNGRIKFVIGDLMEDTDRLFQNVKYDGIFHLGAFTHPPSSFKDPITCYEVNTLGSIRIAESVRRFQPDCVLMQCSTCEVYGVPPDGTIMHEGIQEIPSNPYGASKLAADQFVRQAAKNFGLKCFITRAFSHTGPFRRQNYSISSDAVQIAKIIAGKQEPVIKVGNLECIRSVMDVRDVVDVYEQLMMRAISGEVPSAEVYHVSGGIPMKIGDYLNKMTNMFNIEPRIEVDQSLYRNIDIPVQIPNSDKVRNFLGWKPKIPIDQTLADLVKYWLEKV